MTFKEYDKDCESKLNLDRTYEKDAKIDRVMICPIKQLAYSISAILPMTNDCDESNCAWWFTEKGGCCSITAIAQLLELARHGNFGG